MNSISLSFAYKSRTFPLVWHVLSMLLFLIFTTPIKFSVLKLICDNIYNTSILPKFVFVLKFRHVGLARFDSCIALDFSGEIWLVITCHAYSLNAFC